MACVKTWGNKSKAGKVPCFHQHPLFRPKKRYYINSNTGDCRTCKMCSNNKYCENYEPFDSGVFEYEVIDKE